MAVESGFCVTQGRRQCYHRVYRGNFLLVVYTNFVYISFSLQDLSAYIFMLLFHVLFHLTPQAS